MADLHRLIHQLYRAVALEPDWDRARISALSEWVAWGQAHSAFWLTGTVGQHPHKPVITAIHPVADPLIRALTERGQPYFGICRGFQEVNVAYGGTLHPEIREIPGRFNHRMPPGGTLEEIFELRQRVTFAEGGVFATLMGASEVMTNTLHGQGVLEPGGRIAIDGWADDGTPEALYVRNAPGFTLSVQWHPEFNAANDPVSRRLFSAFGDAVRSWAEGQRPQPMLRTA